MITDQYQFYRIAQYIRALNLTPDDTVQYADYSKAIDTADQKTDVAKLHYLNFFRQTLDMMVTYLYSR